MGVKRLITVFKINAWQQLEMITSKCWPASMEFLEGLSGLGRFLVNTSVIRVIISFGDWSYRQQRCQKVFCATWAAGSIPLSLGCAWYTGEIWKQLWGFQLGNCLPNWCTKSIPKTFHPRTFLPHHPCPSHSAWCLGRRIDVCSDKDISWWRPGKHFIC